MREASLREPLREVLRQRGARLLDAGTPAAVLIPLFEKDGDVHIWLIRRPSAMRDHSGQVAFPGGKAEPSDASPLATALRETREEIGLPESAIDVLGRFDDCITRSTQYRISPFVGWVDGALTPIANSAEVARVFSIPLSTFFAPPESGTPPFRGYSVNNEFVWGATAAIGRGLAEVIRSSLNCVPSF